MAKYIKAKGFKDNKLEEEYSTTIKPQPPLYLFVPSIKEIPVHVRMQHKDEAFVLGRFVKGNKEAWKELRKSGYKNPKQVMILMEQGYVVPKSKMKKLKEVV